MRHVNGYISVVGENGKRIYEHRFIMQKSIGRELSRSEVVHHKNGIKDDNRLENLQLLGNQGEHIRIDHPKLIARTRRSGPSSSNPSDRPDHRAI